MRLPVESFAGRASGLVLALILVPSLAACGSHRELASAGAGPAIVNGPAADYPVVVGAPYKIGDTLYTPVDKMNVDQVGYVAADAGAGVTAAHHTLPLPSYAEVTSLKSGHTILVRVDRRGPTSGNEVIGLSPAALAQLGASAGDPVRVRRMNPLEADRAALRAGRAASPRMDTPASLVAVLKQRLPTEGSISLAPQKPASPAALASVDIPASAVAPAAEPAAIPRAASVPASSRSSSLPLPPLPSRGSAVASLPTSTVAARSRSQPVVVARLEQPAAPAPVAVPVRAQPSRAAAAAETAQPARNGAYIVQAAAMSTRERAQKVASSLGGSVSKAGPYFRVRTGPFVTRQQAEASLAKVRAAGYSDARIFDNG
jgi:rare lipoprotein A